MCRGSNSSGCHPGPNVSCDPGAEARVQWAVAKGSEAVQGWRVPTDTCEAPEHPEAEYELQGYQEETVLFRGAPDWGVLLTKHSCLWLAELNSYVLWKAAGGLSIVCLWRQYGVTPTCLMALTRWSWNNMYVSFVGVFLVYQGSWQLLAWLQVTQQWRLTFERMSQCVSYECKIPPWKVWHTYLIVKYDLKLVCFLYFHNFSQLRRINYFIFNWVWEFSSNLQAVMKTHDSERVCVAIEVCPHRQDNVELSPPLWSRLKCLNYNNYNMKDRTNLNDCGDQLYL